MELALGNGSDPGRRTQLLVGRRQVGVLLVQAGEHRLDGVRMQLHLGNLGPHHYRDQCACGNESNRKQDYQSLGQHYAPVVAKLGTGRDGAQALDPMLCCGA